MGKKQGQAQRTKGNAQVKYFKPIIIISKIKSII